MDAKLINVIVLFFALCKKVLSSKEHVSHAEVKDTVTPIIQLGVDYATAKLTESQLSDKIADKVVAVSENRLDDETKEKLSK